MEHGDGNVSFTCHHDRCRNKTIGDLGRYLRTLLESRGQAIPEILGGYPAAWPDPEPLMECRAPKWPRDLMPKSLEQFTDAVAEQNQTPPAQSKMISIPVLSAAVQARYRVLVGGRPENLATFVCVAGSTGERKSSDIKPMREPIKKFQLDSRDVTRERQKVDGYRRELLQERVDRLKKVAAKSGDQAEEQEYIAARKELDKLVDLTPKRLITQDVTPERLATLMREQGESIAILSAEGGPLENIKNRYQKASSISTIYLEAFSGDEVTVDRKNKDEPAILLSNPSLTMGVMTQPTHLSGILADRSYNGRGLLERFLWCMADERIGYRGRGRAIPLQVSAKYHTTMARILPEPGFRVPGEEFEPRELEIAGEGLEALEEFALKRLEPRFRRGGDLREVRGWATRLPTAVAKIATLWHIYAAAERNEDPPGIVSTKWVKNAIQWVEQFALPMGLLTFGLMGSDPGVGMAHRILDEIREHGYTELKKSEFKDRHFRTVPADDVRLGYKTLIERGYLRKKKIETTGRPRTIYEVNPAVFDPHFGSENIGEEVRRSEKKGAPVAVEEPREDLPLTSSTYPDKADLDPFSLNNLPDNQAISYNSETYVEKKGEKGKKVSEAPVADPEPPQPYPPEEDDVANLSEWIAI